MLRNKLFLIIVSIISVTLIVSGLIYFKNLNDLFDTQIQKDLTKDKRYLHNYLSNIKSNLNSLADEISQNEDLKSSLNLISLYEDPSNYIKETFDYEKNNLIALSLKWIKNSANYSMTLYNKNLDLILLNRHLDGKVVLGYTTYSENQKMFYDYLNKKLKTFTMEHSINTQDIGQFSIYFLKERFLLSYTKEIVLDNNTIGYLQIATCLDSNVLGELNKALNHSTVLTDEDGNYLFATNEQRKILESQSKQLDTSQIVTFNLLNANNRLNAISIVDKSVMNQRLQDIILVIAEVWILFLVLIFLVSVYFVNISILKPIDVLKETIKSIKEGKPFAGDDIKSKNELSDIANDFSVISKELSKNLAFFKSYKTALDRSNIVTKSDLKGNITYVNDNFVELTGFQKEEVLGKPHSTLRHPDNPKELFKELWGTIQSKQIWKKIFKNKDKFGNDYWVDATIVPILDEQENIVEYIAVRHDITQTIEQQNKLDKLANTDILTGLGNRYKLLNDIKNSTQPALAILNIDNFSLVNDFYGHEVGDFIIKKFADNLVENKVTQSCMLYHLQGDEYVLFNQDTAKDLFIESVNKILKLIANTSIEIKGEQLSFGLSTGISFEPKELILATANMALKIAKRDSKNIVIYNPELSLNNEYANNIKWAKKIKQGIIEDKFLPLFQPIVNNVNGNWEKYESLVRMEDEGKLVSPYFFLEISKKSKHYTDITKIMIRKTFEKFKITNLEFSINLTIEDILNNEIQTYIFLALEEYRLGTQVVFEIVESQSIENFKAVMEFIDNVKTYGAKIAIDDFGTGYSNFGYLVQLKVDYIKIDGSLIKELDTNNASYVVVKNIVNFAKDLGMKTIAEFVENESILEKVKELGIDYSQGYYFSAPSKSLKE
ncbi:MAG: EAL domain-containing protein [Campylobacterales bacterium]|nr:EAL domain-containing protein [Campylobacterales bacterium]